jgi:ribokinase
MMGSVLVVGSLHLDVIVRAARLPELDETLMGTAVDYAFGGKGGNQAVAAAKMGARVFMAGRVGKDDFAATIRSALDAAGVDHSGVVTSDGASGMSVAILDQNGEYGAVVVSGVNQDIRADDIAMPPDLSVVILQNEIPEAVNLAICRALPPSAKLVVNAAPARALPDELLARTDVLVVNRVEARMLAGLNASDAELGRSLLGKGVGTVLMTLGAEGVVIEDAGGQRALRGHRVPVHSTHGAGDAFVGALAARLAEGDGLDDAARFANAAAALHVGTQPDIRAAISAKRVTDFLSGPVG